jgi:hypothetical protein
MAFRRSIIVIALVAANVEWPPLRAAAECLRLTGDYLRKAEHVEFIFDGTATEETPVSKNLIRSTVQVHRVWKGSVTQRFVVYGRGQFDTGSVALVRGKRYIVAASQDAPDDLPQGGAFTLPCSATAYQHARGLLRELGRGRAPL